MLDIIAVKLYNRMQYGREFDSRLLHGKVTMEDINEEYDNAMAEILMAELEDRGVFEWVGMDADGDRVLKPNLDKMIEEAPELYDMIMQDLDSSLKNLHDMGLVDIGIDPETGEETFSVSDEGLEILRELGFDFEREE